MTTLTPDKVIEMFVKSVGMRLGLYLSQPSNNIILLLPRVPTRKKQIMINYDLDMHSSINLSKCSM